jgi:hypothetical protein
MTTYRERLWPSPGLLVALLLLIPATILVFLPVDTTVGVVVAIALYAAVAGVLVMTSPTIAVDASGIRAGSAQLPASALGEASAFRGAEATAERGTRLDARAWLVIRGGIPAVVRLELVDDSDPTPYWLIASRRPERLVEAIDEVRQHTRGR